MSPAPHAPCGGQHCPVVAMLLAPRSNPLPSHCHIPFPCPLPVSARRAPMSPPHPRSPDHGRRPEAGVPQDGVRSGEHRLGHTDAALDASRVVDVLRAHAPWPPLPGALRAFAPGAAFAHAGSPRVFGGGLGPKKKRVQWAGRVARARRRKLFGYVLKQGTLRLLRSREVVGSIPRVGSSIPSHKTKLLAVIPPLCRRCSCRGAKFSAERPPMDSARHVAPVGACPSCCERHFAALMPVVHYVCDSRATCMCARRKN